MGSKYSDSANPVPGSSVDATKALRQKFFDELKEEFPDIFKTKDGTPLRDLGKARALNHAEAMALLRAFEKGKIAKNMTIYADRVLCDSCAKLLPAILKKLGVEELTVIYKSPAGNIFKRVVTQTETVKSIKIGKVIQ